MDSLDPKRAAVMSYWIKDYVRFLKKEEDFDPTKLIKYKRGSIVKVHLGYRIGSEEGGLHYAVVIDKDNAKRSPVATVIPLTSVKPSTNLEKLHPSKLYLGDEIYQLLQAKLSQTVEEISLTTEKLLQRLIAIEQEQIPTDLDPAKERARFVERKVAVEALKREVEAWKQKRVNMAKMEEEIGRMKRGSIALVGQITTVSKIRIYDPLYPGDVLTRIRLSDKSLNRIDEKVISFFTGSETTEAAEL